MSGPEREGAAGEETSPARLSELARSESRATRQAVACSAHAPIETLLELLEEFPDEVLANASWMLHLMVEPALLQKISLEAALVLAAQPRTPAAILDQLVMSDPLRFKERRPERRVGAHAHEAWRKKIWDTWIERLAGHPSTPLPRLFQLLLSSRTAARRAVTRNPSAPAAWFDLLVRAGSDPSLLRCSGVQGPITDDERRQLVEGGHWGRVLVAARGDTPGSLRSELVQRAIEDRPVYGSPFCDSWHRDGEELARTLLRSPLIAPPEVLKLCGYLVGTLEVKEGKLVDAVRATLGPTLDPAWVAHILSAGDTWHRTMLASNAHTPGEALLQLAIGDDWESRMAALLNPSLERALLDEPRLLAGLSAKEARAFASRDGHSIDAAPPCLREHLAWFSGRSSARR